MRLRVGAFHTLVFGGTTYIGGDEFDVPDEVAANFLRTGMVLPADGVWPDDAHPTSSAPVQRPSVDASDEDADDDGPCGQCPDEAKQGGRALAVCATPGCPCRVVRGTCQGCRRRHDRGRGGTAHRRAYQAKRWQHTRRDYLRAHPHCQCDDCLQMPEPMRPAATVVDHIDGLGPLGPRGYDGSNLRAMTKAHHDRRTMRDQVHGLDDGA